MSETQAPYLAEQNDYAEAGHFTTHSDPVSNRDLADEAPATANPARLGDATLPAALLGEATERPRMMVGRWPLDHRRANVALPDDREGELLDRLAAAEARAEAAEADNARLRAALTLASGLEDYSSHNHGCGVLKAWSVRMTAGEYACTCGLSDAYRTIRAALAATPADSRERWQRLEALYQAMRDHSQYEKQHVNVREALARLDGEEQK